MVIDISMNPKPPHLIENKGKIKCLTKVDILLRVIGSCYDSHDRATEGGLLIFSVAIRMKVQYYEYQYY
jgi:hypothetical protein